MNLSVASALRIDTSIRAAFIGAGGKTTVIFQAARSISSPVIVTATSHLGTWQAELADRHIIAETTAQLKALEKGSIGIVLVTGNVQGDRTKPVNDDLLNWLHQFCGYHSIPFLIEADGSRQKPLKAWADHEPPIPPFVNLVVHAAGLSGLGKILSEEIVHRADIFSRLSGLTIGEAITTEGIVNAMTHPAGALKNIPPYARRVAVLNQADTVELQSSAYRMVKPLLSAYDSVAISSLKSGKIFAVHEPVAGIVLAAGESARYGQAKQLLDWRGEPFVRAVARTSLEAGLSPVIVVTGANAEKIEAAVRGLDIKTVRNTDWKSGQASSIRAGLVGLPSSPAAKEPVAGVGNLAQIKQTEIPYSPENTQAGSKRDRVGAAVFLLADQPQVTTSVLRALIEKHAEGLHPIVAPMVMDQRANPVLFDRVTFRDLASIGGDVGGRAIFDRYRVEYLPWHDDRLLLDVDTPEMYQRLVSDNTL